MGMLSAKRQRFVNEYLVDLNATQAAIRAGYSERTARLQGPRLLLNDAVTAAVDAGTALMAKRTEITQDYVLTTIKDTIEQCRELGEYHNPAAVLKGTELLAKHLGMLTDKQSIKLEGSMSHDWTVKVVAPGAAVASLPGGQPAPINEPKGRRLPEPAGTDDA